ncbi:hypothetical protein [Gemmiger sp.]|uniref:hypothetical protein n=1 Tax=Gemmiger sp. TaxID=2049027 RepID=UPI003F056FA0
MSTILFQFAKTNFIPAAAFPPGAAPGKQKSNFRKNYCTVLAVLFGCQFHIAEQPFREQKLSGRGIPPAGMVESTNKRGVFCQQLQWQKRIKNGTLNMTEMVRSGTAAPQKTESGG